MSDALLALEDGTTFPGSAFGAPGEAFGEIVFNTGMSGYQEILTDPSYSRQIVVMTAPHQGNYGVNADDPESGDIQVSGFVVREASRRPSSWRSEGSIDEYLAGAGITAIEGIDTRALTLHIRELGAMRAGISTTDLDAASLVERVRSQPGMEGADLAIDVSTDAPYAAADLVGPSVPRTGRVFRVAAYDWGLKRNILRLLARHGCEVDVFPALAPAETALQNGYDGVFLSNGPGDPAATTYAVETTRKLLKAQIPLFGICLGHQIMGRAAGGRTYKLKFGHRGANQPVVDLDSGRVEVTSHNHGFAVEAWGETPPSGGEEAPVVDTAFGRAALTHWNLNDGTLEGMRFLDTPAYCVQYHPEAAPGPHDSRYLFDRFLDLMEMA
ncbi:MAG TPA: glutamine-hydrolyzing carbamoyl-phosphate synthase small subunit [Actinomycetota bacterium]